MGKVQVKRNVGRTHVWIFFHLCPQKGKREGPLLAAPASGGGGQSFADAFDFVVEKSILRVLRLWL